MRTTTARTASRFAATPTSNIYSPLPSRIIRAVVPLPDGMPWDPNSCPFVAEADDGRELLTQWECVAPAVNGSDVKLAEILIFDDARENSHVTLRAGLHRDVRPALTPWALACFQTAPVIDDGFQMIQTQWAPGTHRMGPVCVTKRFFGPHVVGWATFYRNTNIVVLEVKIHNATPGASPWLFKHLNFTPMPGTLLSMVPEPLVGGTYLVRPRSDGMAYSMAQRQQREFRVVLQGPNDNGDALKYVNGHGFGFSDRWTEEEAWGPEQLALPHLPANTLGNFAAFMRGERSRIVQAMTSGAAIDLGAGMQVGKIGFGYMTGVHYGGMTGGSGRWLFDQYGPMTVLAREPAGLQALHGKAAAFAYRMPALIEADGHVCKLEDYIDAQGNPLGGWRMSSANMQFDRVGNEYGKLDGVFGFYNNRNNIPSGIPYDQAEYALMESFLSPTIDEIDFQHFVRAVVAHASLAMLTNDPMAEHTLRGYAEGHRMSMHSAKRLDSEHSQVTANPGHGTDWGRGQGHAYSAQAFAFYLSPADWRDARRAECQKAIEVVCRAQMHNGCVQAMRGNKEWSGPVFQSQHAIQKGTEVAILCHAAYQLERALTGGSAMTDPMLVKLAAQGLAEFHRAAYGAPYNYVAVMPNSPMTADPYVTPPVFSGYDDTEVSVIYAIALLAAERTGADATKIMAAVKRYCGNAPDPRAWLLSQTLYKLELDDTLGLLTALE